MSSTWSKKKKILEEEMLCESLRGRVSYFVTSYHGAPDKAGRFCIRVDGKEYVHANPYNERYSWREECRQKKEQQIPAREWDGKRFLYDEENREVEERVEAQMLQEGKAELYQAMDAITEYMNMDIKKALTSSNEMIRLMAILDRRVGKRTLLKQREILAEQPKWLQFFYQLRFDAEGIQVLPEFYCKSFEELTTRELYEILKTRAEIFVVEQNCAYQDIDGKDEISLHLFSRNKEGRVTACLRIFEKVDEPGVIQIGRVVTLEHGTGLGGRLLREAMRIIEKKYGHPKLYLEAQKYAVGYYAKVGFEVTSDDFLEDGIVHVEMRRY